MNYTLDSDAVILVKDCTNMLFNAMVKGKMLQPVPVGEAAIQIKDYIRSICQRVYFNLRACNGDADKVNRLVQEAKYRSDTALGEEEQIESFIYYCTCFSLEAIFSAVH